MTLASTTLQGIATRAGVAHLQKLARSVHAHEVIRRSVGSIAIQQSGGGGDGTARDPHRRALSGARRHAPNVVSPCESQWRAPTRWQATPRREAKHPWKSTPAKRVQAVMERSPFLSL